MPSPAALAKFAMAFIVAPLNQGPITTPVNEAGVHTTGDSGIYFCVDGGFSGYCRHMTGIFGQCSKFNRCQKRNSRKTKSAASESGRRPGVQSQLRRPGQGELVHSLRVSR